MRAWIALMAVVMTLGMFGCSQSPTSAAASGALEEGVQASVNDSVSADPSADPSALTEAESPAPAALQQVGSAVATAGDDVEVTDEELSAEEAAITAEAEAEAAQNIDESNYLRILAELEQQIGADDGA